MVLQLLISTQVGLQFRVDGELVDSQGGLPCELFLALVTLEWLLT